MPTEKKSWNRDDAQKVGSPPRSAYEPTSAEDSSSTHKTLTDPATGEPNEGAPEPNTSGKTRKAD